MEFRILGRGIPRFSKASGNCGNCLFKKKNFPDGNFHFRIYIISFRYLGSNKIKNEKKN
jgi:hypothetical protein